MEERERESKRRGRELVVGGEDKRVWSSKQCTIAGLVGLGERWRKRNDQWRVERPVQEGG